MKVPKWVVIMFTGVMISVLGWMWVDQDNELEMLVGAVAGLTESFAVMINEQVNLRGDYEDLEQDVKDARKRILDIERFGIGNGP